MGVDLAGGVCEPSEKKSVVGAADMGFWGYVDMKEGGFPRNQASRRIRWPCLS